VTLGVAKNNLDNLSRRRRLGDVPPRFHKKSQTRASSGLFIGALTKQARSRRGHDKLLVVFV
jgi:hypothetical protein